MSSVSFDFLVLCRHSPFFYQDIFGNCNCNCDNFLVTKANVEKISDWENTSPKKVEIPFMPACVLLQDNGSAC